MPRSRKVTTVVDQENIKPEMAATTKTKKTNKKEDVKKATGTLKGDQIKVVKNILLAQSDASSKKCLADLTKIYTAVSILLVDPIKIKTIWKCNWIFLF